MTGERGSSKGRVAGRAIARQAGSGGLSEAYKQNGEWRRVVFACECDEDGNCPVCGIDYGECECPGPTQDGMEYREIDGDLYAREEQ